MTSILRRSPRGRFVVYLVGAVVLASLGSGCQSRPSATPDEAPLARTSLPIRIAVPMSGNARFFQDRLAVAIQVEPVRSADDTDSSRGPKQGPKGGPGKGGNKTGLNGGVQVQANNQGASASSNVGYSVGPATVGTSVGTNGFGGMQLGISNNRGGSGGRGGAGGPGSGGPKSAPNRGGQADPEALVHITLSNNSAEPLELYIIDLVSPLGSFVVHPGHVVLDPDQTLALDPLPSFLAAGLDHSEATLVLRVGSERETRKILLQQDIRKTVPSAGATDPATPTPSSS